MRLVTERELKRSLWLSNLFAGTSGAALTGLLLALWLYVFLGMGVGA